MTASEIRSRLERLVEELNAGDRGAIERHLSSQFYVHDPSPGEPTAVDVFGGIVGDLMVAMPDLTVTLHDPIEVGEEVQARLVVQGTKNGQLWGSPPSGTTVTWEAAVTVRSRRGGIAIAFPSADGENEIAALRRLEVVNPPDEMHLPTHHPVSLPDDLMRVLFNRQAADPSCLHLDLIRVTEPDTDVCAKCLPSGDVWPSLRMCLVCGHVGCCDTSKNRHAHAHFEETGHPLMRSIRMDEGWVWCYVDQAMFSTRTLEEHRRR